MVVVQTKNSTGADHAPLAYRVAHFCRAIGIGRTKFYELMASGKIRTIVVGGRRLVPAAEAQRLAREGSE
jgi:excisionase family DNA binding protein